MKIEATICSAVTSGVKALYGQDVPEKMVQLQKTKREFEGNLTLVVLTSDATSPTTAGRWRRTTW